MKHLAFYMTFHYPTRNTFLDILNLLDQEEAGYVEIGIPVLNPYMDGSVIQKTHQDVLEQKPDTEDLIQTLTEIRRRFHFKVVLMTYREGVEQFRLKQIPDTLYDGLICVDGAYPPEVFHNQIAVLSQPADLPAIKKALLHNHLFAYIVSGEGKTGSFARLPDGYIEVIKKVKAVSSIPAFVGFGIKSAANINEVMKNGADGAIIGTEFIRRYQQGGLEALREYLNELKEAE